MANTKADLLLHPVRLRIVLALGDRHMTARQLTAELTDVPQATLYHHLGLLTAAGLLRVAEERPVRGTVEKVYALTDAETAGSLGPGEGAEADRDALMRALVTFTGALVSEFTRYLTRERIDLAADGVGFRQRPFYLSDEEFARFVADLNAALLPYAANQPAPGRTRRLFSTIVMPTSAPASADQESSSQ